MKLTVDINFADRTASLAERHSLAAGDTYNPLVLELSRLTEAELASVDTGTLSLVLYRSQADRTVVASANMFSVPTGKKSLRTAALLLNQQSMKDWFAAEGYKKMEMPAPVANDLPGTGDLNLDLEGEDDEPEEDELFGDGYDMDDFSDLNEMQDF